MVASLGVLDPLQRLRRCMSNRIKHELKKNSQDNLVPIPLTSENFLLALHCSRNSNRVNHTTRCTQTCAEDCTLPQQREQSHKEMMTELHTGKLQLRGLFKLRRWNTLWFSIFESFLSFFFDTNECSMEWWVSISKTGWHTKGRFTARRVPFQNQAEWITLANFTSAVGQARNSRC